MVLSLWLMGYRRGMTLGGCLRDEHLHDAVLWAAGAVSKSLELTHPAQLKLCTHEAAAPHCSYPQTLEAAIAVSASRSLTALDFS